MSDDSLWDGRNWESHTDNKNIVSNDKSNCRGMVTLARTKVNNCTNVYDHHLERVGRFVCCFFGGDGVTSICIP